MHEQSVRPTWVEVDLDAIRHNASALKQHVGSARICAVLKAFAYGHGPVRVAEAALAGGAEWLAVALVEEARLLRMAGITEPIVVLSEPPPVAMNEVVITELRPAIYTHEGIEAAAKAVAAMGGGPLPVHLKIDTGMNRVGAQMKDALALAQAIESSPELLLEGVFTHLAVADELLNPFTVEQLERFNSVLAQLRQAGIFPSMVHAANSAAAIAVPESRFDMVRCGIALYGLAPSRELEGVIDLRPALSLKSAVSHVKRVGRGERLSYGLRYKIESDCYVATVPIGYADGVRRELGAVGGEVLIRGKRRRIAGTVTMDQLLVDCADDAVQVGDEVVLIGEQGSDRITAWDLAERLNTISYEIVCAIGTRVPRRYLP